MAQFVDISNDPVTGSPRKAYVSDFVEQVWYQTYGMSVVTNEYSGETVILWTIKWFIKTFTDYNTIKADIVANGEPATITALVWDLDAVNFFD